MILRINLNLGIKNNMYTRFNLLFLPALALTYTGCHRSTLPNIVIIYADDMGYGDLGCQNPDSKIPTPNLDRLASQGMRFTDAHSASTVSSPSRYSLLTGRYHWRGYLKEGIVSQWGDPAIEEGRETIASMLKKEGYITACIGKWHLGQIWPFKPGLGQDDPGKKEWSSVSMNGKGPWAPEDFDWSQPIKEGPVTRGFDYYFGTGTINFPPYTWIENDRVIETPVEMLDLKDDLPQEGAWECRPGPAAKDWDIRKVPVTLMEHAVKWINDRKYESRPFFLYYALPSPHAPIIPGEDFRGKSKAGGFGDYVTETDRFVGNILDALKNNGFEENTIVIFTSDNGPEYYAYERIRSFSHYSMDGFRGLKRDLWEGGHRVPFIVRYPGKVPAGTLSEGYLCQTDLMATLAGLLNIKVPEGAGEDSFNQAEIFLGRATQSHRDHLVYHAINGIFAIRKDNFVLVDAKTAEVTAEPLWIKEKLGAMTDTTPVILYNLADDTQQINNLSVTDTAKVRELKKFLEKIKTDGRSVRVNN